MTDDPGSRAEGPSGNDRRDLPRVAAKFRVRFRSLDDLVVTYTHDISQGGLFIGATDFLPIGSIVQLRVELPDGLDPARIIARVAYVLDAEQAAPRGRSAGMGMEFLDADGAAISTRVATYLASAFGETADRPETKVDPARILVVDDSATYRAQAEAVMRADGHQVTLAVNGLEALGVALREPPDLILSDVNMPSMDGWQLLRMIRSRPSTVAVPVVFLTTLGGEAERLKGYQLGVDDYIPKPFDDRELSLRVARILDRTRRRPLATAGRNALRGDLSQVGLGSLLSFVSVERRTGLLLVITDERIASLYIRDGDIVRAELPPGYEHLDGIEKVFELLGWEKGRFELSSVPISAADELRVPTSYILMEHARKLDEEGR